MTELDISTVRALLATTLLGRPLRYLPTVTSTQELAREAARAGAAEGLAVVAGQQTAGRGRANRPWWSPPRGGLYLSLLLRPRLTHDRITWLTMCLALGASEAVRQQCGVQPEIKWPNDLQVNGQKLAGILLEGAFSGNQLEYVVAGLGLNVNNDFSQHPELHASATSLKAQLGHEIDMAGLLATILKRIEVHYLALKHGKSPQPGWAARLTTLGQPIRVQFGDGLLLQGIAQRVMDDGTLEILLEDGRRAEVRAADVTLRA